MILQLHWIALRACPNRPKFVRIFTLEMENFKSRIDFTTLEDTAGILKSLAHPVRLAIIDLLKETPTMTVGSIQEELSIEQAAASYHLLQMKQKGILSSDKKANKVFYRIDNDKALKILELFF
jgi:DNA-binding transcriptional ArsR family regulator